MDILGIACHYHDAAACLMRDGRIVAAAQEERFSRVKHDPDFPIRAINECFAMGETTALGLDRVVFYEKPFLKLGRTVFTHLGAAPFSGRLFLRTMPEWLARRLALPLDIAKDLAFDGPVSFVKHHLAHASSAFLVSPFEEAAVITADGLGEWATTSWGVGRGNSVEIRRELHYPDSLGLLYSAVTTWLGFRANSDEGRVMALASFAEPTRLDAFRRMVEVKPDGSFSVSPRYFDFVCGRRMFGRRFVRLFGPPREPGEAIGPVHYEVAASLQAFTEDILVRIARHVHAETGLTRLCAAGGVFLNCVANSRILADTPFEEIYVQPAAGDSGGALGAAACLSHSVLDLNRAGPMASAALGPSYSSEHMRRSLVNRGIEFRELADGEMPGAVAGLLEKSRVVGFFQGRMEFGPRALGGRSILANPCDPTMKDHLNLHIKHRETFRPYGVSILLDRVPEFFEFDGPSPFMLLVARARPQVRERIPSALHVDGTSRLQTLTRGENGIYHDVVEEFGRRTGVPMVINTSFNDHGEPIVCTPEDACDCFLRIGIDALAMGNFLAERRPA